MFLIKKKKVSVFVEVFQRIRDNEGVIKVNGFHFKCSRTEGFLGERMRNMNTETLIFSSGFMMFVTSALFLRAHFSMLKRKAVRVRVQARDSVDRRYNNLR